MSKRMQISTLFIILLVSMTCRAITFSKKDLDGRYPIIPKPMQLVPSRSEFHLLPDTPLVMEGERTEELRPVLAYFSRLVGGSEALEAPVAEGEKIRGKRVVFFLAGEDAGLGPEGYELEVTARRILFKASSAAGLFYAVQTLRQLLPPDFESEQGPGSQGWIVPGVRILDKPRYRWRGMMLDVCRHFFPKEFVKKLMDEIAMYKLNTLHLHLTEDQGWRLEIKKYPRLTEIGAWREDREDLHWNARNPDSGRREARYGGYYSQDDIRELLAYAESRFITIIPEIEMPAHSVAALAAYPELSCASAEGPFSVLSGGYWPISDIYCAGKEQVFTFLENVLEEVIALFPGTYIHIGGDEADKTNWRTCPDCQARLKSEGLKDEDELQSYFIKRMERFINARNRKLIGWDEILEGGLAPQAAVMSWRGTSGGISAARAGHDVVMSPTSHCYFDYFQGRPDSEPLAIGGYLPLEKVYGFEPTPDELSEEEAGHILGAQANLWTEYVGTPEHAEYMIFPRIMALAEVVWSQKKDREFSSFIQRLDPHNLESLGINHARSLYDIGDTIRFKPKQKELEIALQAQLPTGIIRFTRDGGTPTDQSSIFQSPITIGRTTRLKAGVFEAGRLMGKMFFRDYIIHQAAGCSINLKIPYEEDYDGGDPKALTDCIRGSKNSRDGHWQGFLANDVEAVIDLGAVLEIHTLKAGFLLDITRSIFLPESVAFSISADGTTYEQIAYLKNEVSQKIPAVVVEDFQTETGGVEARFIKLEAKNRGICPPWHVAAGKKTWLFADEIIIQ
jgi:hexosaminidase